MKEFFNRFGVLLIITIVSCLIIWPLMDLGWSKWIAHDVFAYTVRDHIIEPIIAAVLIVLVQFLFSKKKK